ncbi:MULTISPECIES: metallophosphoesterase [Methanobacterium]|uniref:Metallophosphoesterase n=1 Tax=Methanobacterium formicicum TaxID=2162 RepID=A0A090I548_METFO|nr:MULTISPECIES: metallophosphoesterase [Methanobacterium]KUK75640.1 MAG: Putative phosphohydrolase [Methanobacterium sp. 42_16]MDD4809676.1 metallophosphoesterase [Methanobacterium formicicum]MDG3546392.1 metallophosphoesterase [Methanobacterium formicicum]MDH2659658.1 metallophosphoesterase [Methanobacterium formicicum]CEA14772.1 metallophosphoesterase [Methanobacterium formicicum]
MVKKRYLFLGILFLLIAYMFLEPYWIETKEITIESDQIPAQFDGKKIVFLSDIHASPNFSQERIDGVVSQVNALNPDLVLLGGDYVDGDSEYVQSTFASLSKLEAPLGVYAVLGNKDPQYVTLNAIPDYGITYIGNKGTWIEENGSRIRLGGVGDYNNGAQIQNATTAVVTPQDFVILLSHNPDYFPKVDTSKVDLVLSGHTHGGQVTFFGLWAPSTHSDYGNKYRTGVIEENNSTLVVSNGLGTTILPIRFFARPQILVITLKKT